MWESIPELPAPWEEMECNFPVALSSKQREFSRLGFSWHIKTGFGVFGCGAGASPCAAASFPAAGICPAARDEPEAAAPLPAPGCPGHYGFVE